MMLDDDDDHDEDDGDDDDDNSEKKRVSKEARNKQISLFKLVENGVVSVRVGEAQSGPPDTNHGHELPNGRGTQGRTTEGMGKGNWM